MQGLAQQFLDSLLARNLSENTIRAYRPDIAEFLVFASSERPTRRDVKQYLAYLHSRNLKRASVTRKIATMKSFYAWLHAEELAPEAAAILSCLRAPRPVREIPPWPSEAEVKTLTVEPFHSAFPERDKVIIHLLYSTGIRASELAGINLSDFRGDDTVLVRGKGRKHRLVIFGEPAQDALRDYLPARAAWLKRREQATALHAQGHGFHEIGRRLKIRWEHARDLCRSQAEPVEDALLIGRRGFKAARLTSRSIGRIVGAVAKSKGLDVHPHGFRHACASHLLEHGASIAAVKQLLGHGNLSTTERYTHISAGCILRHYNKAHPHARSGLA